MKQVEKQTHKNSPINTTVLIRMKVPVTSTMFTNLTCKLSLCVCVFRTECSLLSISCLCASIFHTTLHGYIYTQPKMSGPKDPIDGPKDHLSSILHSKDEHGPRRMILRGLIFDAYLSSTSKDQQYPSRLSFDTDKHTTYWPSQTRRIVDLVNLQTHLGHRLHTDRIQTKYRHKCTNSLSCPSSYLVSLGKTRKNFKDVDHPNLLHLPADDESYILAHQISEKIFEGETDEQKRD
ncbi:hypothetical protein HanPI659440_Chr15g0580111 [Helianthus annuus]|nr:hypothetical protein HanPI659440_Chr15g0580111 [Helianthus annuus]